MKKVKHLLGISGGKDSAALAIYMSQKYPELDTEYYTCDTGKELKETYDLIGRLNSVLGKDIELYKSMNEDNSPMKNPFDHFLAMYGGYLPSATARWCTNKMKLQPFESYVGDEPTISYVGIRGDENREGYISKKENIQTIFPFRKNIWSEDVIKKLLSNSNIEALKGYYNNYAEENVLANALQYIEQPISPKFTQTQKLNALMDVDLKLFNKVVFEFLKTTDYPIGKLEVFPLIENDEIIGIDDVFQILEESGVGIPAYYKPIEYQVEIDGEIKKGTYSRSRSGCFFCFYQQKIEWVWLLEQHPELYAKAIEYEKEGYTWMAESLEVLNKPERVASIKKEHFLRMNRQKKKSRTGQSWQDEILDAEGEGCASCFI
ncbi:phosphoadenosine phosphosulfate reductase family protein [Tenacibaculum finnmarkense]|uniref:phosphoadenosine phosphosulfate reductase domain-containing protein n=1 Tax=Tenacibaculum TaxID=104267 RepID=UPI001E599E1C|nr:MULTISPECIES: phosphoadenosine phosphosulfate reductase family protein [Tenacibaculum]MCD8452872.1 phosphoadenosine phosphosulfate reductase family protein [Tenacibaculum finnmarkense genomovar ulcerans]MCG8804139.1 phosphoadenosine phosphosulfate reductase family protein [Tenacibaculum finnmarkense]MCG8856121.1 phosphoadenosine phosphosulfate reductase family protein [Tenacibaculum finnmarkense]